MTCAPPRPPAAPDLCFETFKATLRGLAGAPDAELEGLRAAAPSLLKVGPMLSIFFKGGNASPRPDARRGSVVQRDASTRTRSNLDCLEALIFAL